MIGSERYAPAFQRMIDDPVATLEELQADAARFEANTLASVGQQFVPNSAIPALGSLGFMAFRRGGQRIALPDNNWLSEIEHLDALLGRRSLDKSGRRSLVIERADGRPQHLAWHDWAEAKFWNLPQQVRDACETGDAHTIVMVAGGAAGDGPLTHSAKSFGLTDLETRVVVAVIRTGSPRSAARTINLSYATVREALGTAAQRLHQPNTAALVRAIVFASFGILPDDHDGEALLTDMLPLSMRQAQLALLICDGLTRDEAARAIPISAAVAKKELAAIYSILGVGSAAELARLIAEVRAMRAFTRATDGTPGYLDFEIEPTRRTHRIGTNDYIAWTDHGPASGRAVLIVHSNWQCRAVPKPMVTALQAQGWRPIAIDRPGFGATPLGRSSITDPFGQAISDTVQILDHLKQHRIAIIARCGAQFVHALKLAVPDRIGPVLLVSPTPHTDDASQRKGLVGAVKEAFYRSPKMVEFFMRLASAQHSIERIEALTRALVKGSASDEALCNDPSFIRDRFQAIRPFSTGNLAGAIIEEHRISHSHTHMEPIETDDWMIVQGAQDMHNSIDDVRRYWGPVFPTCPIKVVEDGGRFMNSSHAQQLVDILQSLN